MAMAGIYQEARIDQGVDKKNGQETNRRCLGRAGLRRFHSSEADEWRTSDRVVTNKGQINASR